MARQLARNETRDPVPDSIPAPDILPDFNVWAETHWTEAQIHTAPSTWLTQIMMAHAESSRIQAELYEPAYHVDPKKERRRPIDDAEIEMIRAGNPKFRDLPSAALRKLYKKRG